MKQKFSKKLQKKFLEYFKAKDKPGKIENEFYKKTYKYIKIIKWLPGLQMVAVGNSVSMNSATKNSDIDLFIVTNENSLWFVRIFVTLIFSVLGVRKTAKKHAGRFCLSFFVTRKGLDFSSWKLENDIYLYFWIVYLKPILNYNNTYEEFLKMNSSWADFSEYEDIIKENKRFIKFTKTSPQPSPFEGEGVDQFSSLKRGKQKESFFIEGFLKKVFLPKTLKHYEKIGKPFGVIINDDVLKFHNGDIRKKVKKEILG